jgi:hypothetical protein
LYYRHKHVCYYYDDLLRGGQSLQLSHERVENLQFKQRTPQTGPLNNGEKHHKGLSTPPKETNRGGCRCTQSPMLRRLQTTRNAVYYF